MELLNDQGLRPDGRKPNELRIVRCKLGAVPHADGSSYLELGNTKVLVSVFGPYEVRSNHRSKTMMESAFINCQYSMAPFSKPDRRTPRPRDKKNMEMTINLHQALKSVIRAELLPRTQIDVMVEVLTADGGNYCAALNASTLALIDAGVPLREYVIACTSSLAKNEVPMVDISHLEETLGGPCLTVAMLPTSKQIAFTEMSQRFHVDHLEKVMATAQKGCEDMFKILNNAVRLYFKEIGFPNNFGQE
uniref:Putative exosome complex component RRP41 n=1 Tax=Lygus hesperus TaxID=30085 RepID=A0A0A9XZ42_LYGHE